MSDEIKEILEWLSDKDIYLEDNGYLYKRISLGETNLLLDYITNLQEKYERMKENAEILSNGCNELEKRNEKAIDKMKDIKYDLNIEPWSIYQVKGNVLFDLLNILQGEQNE
jgi:hypothetical protein